MAAIVSVFAFAGCGSQPGVTNVNLSNSGSSATNTVANTANTNAISSRTPNATSTIIEAKEPAAYQAVVSLKLEAVGDQQNIALPTLRATVARSGDDRRMEFAMPAGGRVVFLDKAGNNYLILPDKKQFAQLNRESLGFEVRRMLMPEQIVDQVKSMQGMQLAGEEKYNGRDALKYSYEAVTNTQTQAGQVVMQSSVLVDKETGLPLRSETISQSQSGGNVQGYTGFRIITEIIEIKTDVPTDLFAEPAGFQKIESEQVRSQVDMMFNSVAMLIGQLMKQGGSAASPAPTSPGK